MTKHLSRIYIRLCSLIHPICRGIATNMTNMKIIPFEINELPIDKPLIFAANHSNVHDVPVLLSIIKRHVFVLAGDEVKDDINGLAFRCNGVVWVHRGDRENSKIAKFKIKELLQQKRNVLIFPEGTWNLTPNLPMLPLHWGAVEFAQEMSVPIIPITLEYTKDNQCYYSIGRSICISKDEEKTDATRNLRDILSTMRWKFWDEHSKKLYTEITYEDFYEYTQYRLDEYPKLNVNFEETTILKKFQDFEEVFEHLNYIKPTNKNAFLFNKRLK